MALPTTYSTGTASINANEVAVSGQGTTWLASGLQDGDLFWAAGMSVRIASVNSNTSLTLAFPWPGANRSALAYEVRLTPEPTRVLASARAVLNALAGGNVKAFGDLASAADKLGYFTGAGTLGLTDFKAMARTFLAANFMPVQQGGGFGQGDHKLRMGWTGSEVLLQVDNYELGGIWTDLAGYAQMSTPGYQKLPSGLIIQWGYVSTDGGPVTVGFSFPVTFPNQVFVGLASMFTPGLPVTSGVEAHLAALSTSGMAVETRVFSNGGSVIGPAGAGFSWLAVGF